VGKGAGTSRPYKYRIHSEANQKWLLYIFICVCVCDFLIVFNMIIQGRQKRKWCVRKLNYCHENDEKHPKKLPAQRRRIRVLKPQIASSTTNLLSLTADVLDSAVPAMERIAMLFNRQHDRADTRCDVLVIKGREIEDRMLIMVVDNM
jgi:hypothetical protein